MRRRRHHRCQASTGTVLQLASFSDTTSTVHNAILIVKSRNHEYETSYTQCLIFPVWKKVWAHSGAKLSPLITGVRPIIFLPNVTEDEAADQGSPSFFLHYLLLTEISLMCNWYLYSRIADRPLRREVDSWGDHSSRSPGTKAGAFGLSPGRLEARLPAGLVSLGSRASVHCMRLYAARRVKP